MLSGRQITGIRRFQRIHPLVFLPLVIAIITAIPACTASKGSIVILESLDGKGCTMDFREWTSSGRCELSLSGGDVLQVEVEVEREDGSIALTISGENGSEPYTGNNLAPGIFTVTVSETDKYLVIITGSHATGRLTVKKR